ncbi:hypothetical protein BU649_10445 [Staphylococcus chromogenes]|uniref:Phage protein n=2 Tax=Staphylococcus chromogenes TaxID=46126 RepID=A0ABX5I5Z6_STACR|nr:hypothetical protein [Staphylococcus chromogenes]PTG01835.1 hypothetical protein BU649_10445 [Staphylococcus chromogenes]PTG09745.1 hypothetical protein BU647_02825 [Staphylococcus chromogenes]PTG68286.1 hypothetical protein BU676_10395 [Staphylococcus chromogenes]RIL88746.1 hypothetical protein BUX98_10060 [Staphylococcus chromogenes]RIM11802.1 hypothetical protein BU688_06640 [Staphylococcus chromogenes]
MRNEKEQMIFYLMNKYKELIQLEMDYQEWKEKNVDKSKWDYKSKRPTKAELKRYRLLLKELMIEFEKEFDFYG